MPGMHETHTRSVDAVGATDCSRPGPHTVNSEHTRFDVAVLGVSSNCVELHTVRAGQDVSERKPHGAA